MRRASPLLSAALAVALAAPACIYVHAEDDRPRPSSRAVRPAPEPKHLEASARIEGKSGCSLRGRATFIEAPGGVEVRIQVEDAPPGMHAVHVHEAGDCSDPEGKSAGGHFNPSGMAHGAPHAAEHHAGDLGNMWVDENGDGYHVVLMHDLAVGPGPRSVVGRAVIIHEKADDLVSQPTGAAGGRIGCGVIR